MFELIISNSSSGYATEILDSCFLFKSLKSGNTGRLPARQPLTGAGPRMSPGPVGKLWQVQLVALPPCPAPAASRAPHASRRLRPVCGLPLTVAVGVAVGKEQHPSQG